MDVREKLVELIVWIEDQMTRAYPYTTDQFRIETTVDHLIANGVTVQEWIPVTELLPDENNRWVLCLCVGGAMEVLKFDYAMRDWDAQYPGRCYMENYVTHWMPLPEPPKEEGT